MADFFVVRWSKRVDKQLDGLPIGIIKKFYTWIKLVKLFGVRAVRLIAGYHDEPLVGSRHGQRSIRLNRSYRVIYIERLNDTEYLEVIEVNKHEY